MSVVRVLLGVMMVFMLSCSGGGDGGAASVDDIQEGSGVSIDLSSQTDLHDNGGNVLSESAGAVSKIANAALIQGLGIPVEANKMYRPGVVDAKICERKELSVDLNGRTESPETGGSAVFSGTAEVKMPTEDSLSWKWDVSVEFADYSFKRKSDNAIVRITGSSKDSVTSQVSQNYSKVCEAVRTNPEYYRSQVEAGWSGERHMVGSLSVSGAVGAAITYDILEKYLQASDSNESEDAVSGEVNIKSGGKVVKCTVEGEGIYSSKAFSLKCVPEA